MIMMKCFLRLLWVLVLSISFPKNVESTVIERVSSLTWDGIAMYIPIDRGVVQEKLDEFHNSMVDQCNRPTLFLPETQVFPDILTKDQHVVYIDIGYAVDTDFRDSSIDTQGVTVAVTIPFLSSRSNKAPHYSLALAKLYDRRRGEITKPNIAFPYLPIDKVTFEDNVVVLQNGSDEFRLTYTRYTDPCKSAPSVVRHEFEDFIQYDMQLGAPEPHFDVCSRHPNDGKFCSIVREISCDVSRIVPNFCQLAWKSDDMVTCEASIEVLNITSGFRDFMLLKDTTINIIASESISGHFPIGIKYPCID